jgi:hypothetical protein
VVDEHTGQSVTDGALHQGRRDRRIHPTGQPADGTAIADLGPYLLDQGVGDVGGRPRRVDARELVQEPTQHLLSVGRVHHLGVVLHPRELPGAIFERSDWGARTDGNDLETLGSFGDRVPVAHPHRLGFGKIRMKLSAGYLEFGTPVFTGAGVCDGAAQRLRHRLEPVADPEDRYAQVE